MKLAPKALRVLLCALLCAAALLGLSAPCCAADTAMTVRVGFFAFDGYHMQDENGSRSGYGYELLQHLAAYANLQYEYVGYDKSWAEMQDMLARGEIDLLTSAQKTPEREERFDFSAASIGVSSAILTVKAGDTRYLQGDCASWSGIRIGMLENNSRNESLAQYAAENGFSYTPVYFDNTDAMVAELKSDEAERSIDAVLTSNLRRIDGEWTLAQFASSPFYVMVQKGNSELLARIDRAIEQMDAYEPGLRTRLMNKFYRTSGSEALSFTAEERAYIQRMQGEELTAVINPDRAPYSWLEDGEWKGIVYDLAQDILRRSGLSVTFLTPADRSEYERLIDDGAVDIRFDSEYNISRAEEDGFWLTPAYMTVPAACLARTGTSGYRTAAVPTNRDAADNLAKLLEERGTAARYYDSIDEIVAAVTAGDVDAAYLAMDTATMAVRDNVTRSLTATEVFGTEISYAVEISREQDPLLFSVLLKTVASMDDGTVDAARQTYSEYLETPFSLIGYFYEYPLRVLLSAVALLGTAILLLAALSQFKRRRIEHAHLETERAQNERLKDALDAAEKAAAAKSQFLSRVSHEMRTPLNAIIGFLDLAGDAEPEQRENYLASTEIAAKQLLNVINDVLDMSSIESGKMKLASAPFNFKRLLSSITGIYGTQCKQKGVAYETRLTTPLDDWLVGDELRLNQILMNLLGNAVKFTAAGSVRLTVSCLAEREDRFFLRFEVADTGCGMSAEMQERLFQPFEQESASTARKYGGSGLGLSIVKSLVTMMDGAVRVESRPGEGSCFAVDLPFGKSDIRPESALPRQAERLRILAVDDEAAERDYMEQVLRRMHVRFTTVGSGAQALDALAAAEAAGDGYNVCLLDWKMPGLNGFELTRHIRQTYGEDVVVIIVSAYDFQQVGEQAKQAGANLLLSKPVFQSSLFDLLMTLTDGKTAAPAEGTPSWSFAGRRVLLAEDNTLNQIVAKAFLAKLNLVVDLAENGQIALERFLASPAGYYDAILMDVQMPVMDGYQAAKAIRASDHPDAKTIQIIAQTADAFNEDIARALSAGMNAHVSKPIEPQVLAEALQTAFRAGGV